MKVDEQVSLDCECGGEEVEEGGAAEVGDDQGDQGEKPTTRPFKCSNITSNFKTIFSSMSNGI